MRNEALKAARAEIEAILKRYDMAGFVVLHDGKTRIAEKFWDLSPSYSKLHFVPVAGGMTMRLRSKAADYGGDTERQRRDLEATANMAALMAELMVDGATMLLEASSVVDEATGAEHTGLAPFTGKDEH